jgi:hypothetical protein
LNWRKEIEACGHFWTSKQGCSDRWPRLVYHLTYLHPKPDCVTQNKDGTSNAGPKRDSPGSQGLKDPAIRARAHAKLAEMRAKKAAVGTPYVQFKSAEDLEKWKTLAFQRLALMDFNSPRSPASTCHVDGVQRETLTAFNATRSPASTRHVDGVQRETLKSDNATRSPDSTLKTVLEGSESVSLIKGEGEPPPDLEFEAWKKKNRNCFEREVALKLSKLRWARDQADAADREWFQKRIDFLKSLEMGGKPPARAVKLAPAPKASEPEKPCTSAELRESLRVYTEKPRSGALLTAMKQALARAEAREMVGAR